MRIMHNSRLTARISGSAVLLFCLSGALAVESEDAGQETPANLEQVQADWGVAIESLKDYSVVQRDAAVAEAGEVLEQMDEQLEVLERKTAEEWEGLSEEARETRLGVMRELEKQRAELAEWYGGMKHSSAEAWTSVQDGFIAAYKTMTEAWQEAEDDFAE